MEIDNMRHDKLLSAERCTLLVVDIQDAFKTHIPDMERVVERSRVMIEAAGLLEIPIVVTEQYPKGLGRTVEPLRKVLGECEYYDKVTFSCLQDEKTKKAIADTDHKREQLLIVGIETHVCIAQTAYDAIAMGLRSYIAVDAVSSRHAGDNNIALKRLRSEGCVLTTTEAAIMEMTISSRHPKFREISKLIK
jgi:isochorismate hydrolase